MPAIWARSISPLRLRQRRLILWCLCGLLCVSVWFSFCKLEHHSQRLITAMEAPYGSWKSPLTGEFVSAASKRLEGAAVDSHGRLLWLEGRPSEDGRSVLVRGGEDITPENFNVRAAVHACTGGSFTLTKHGDIVVFSSFEDQRLYKQDLDKTGGRSRPIALTPSYEGEPSMRYADGDYDAIFDRIIIVREDCRQNGAKSITETVAVNLKGDRITEPKVLVRGSDFYSFPRLSPDGSKLAWMEWSLPNMPFDRSSIWVGEVSPDGDIVNPVCVAGGAAEVVEAPSEPKWSPRGDLVFVSDRGNGYILEPLFLEQRRENCESPPSFGGRVYYTTLGHRHLFILLPQRIWESARLHLQATRCILLSDARSHIRHIITNQDIFHRHL